MKIIFTYEFIKQAGNGCPAGRDSQPGGRWTNGEAMGEQAGNADVPPVSEDGIGRE